jgi:sterol desaturase/sphingolipid hydroxylase (fatty acid hydroxylase superfamily)
VLQLGVVLLAGVSWERWAQGHGVFDLSAHLRPWAGGLLAYFIATFVFYWWHRWRHESPLLWRLFHRFITARSASKSSRRSTNILAR